MVTWAMVACGKCAPQDTGCVSCMCLAAQHGTRVLKVVNCHKTLCKPVCQWLNAYWLGLSQGHRKRDAQPACIAHAKRAELVAGLARCRFSSGS